MNLKTLAIVIGSQFLWMTLMWLVRIPLANDGKLFKLINSRFRIRDQSLTHLFFDLRDYRNGGFGMAFGICIFGSFLVLQQQRSLF